MTGVLRKPLLRRVSRGAATRLAGLVLGATLAAGGLAVGSNGPSEYEVKAAVLYNVVKFVQWPPAAFGRPSAPIVVAVAGRDPFGPVLERTLEGRRAHGRPLEIRRFASPRDIDFCHVLYVTAAEDSAAWLEALRLSQAGAALTVGESDDFASGGGTLTLRLVERRVRFEIDLQVAREAGLEISSQLLALARVAGQP